MKATKIKITELAEKNPSLVILIDDAVSAHMDRERDMILNRDVGRKIDYLSQNRQFHSLITEVEKKFGKDALENLSVKTIMYDQFERVIESYKESAKEYRKKRDKNIADCYASDARDLQSILDDLREDTDTSIKAAAKAAQHLDTIVREAIPELAWDYMMKRDEITS